MSPHPFPRLRWAALAFLAVWAPAYASYYEWANFLGLCDVAVVLTVAGLLLPSPLLLSSQALSSIVIDSLWCLDVGWRAATGHHLIGGTEYMWDPRWPLWLRGLSLFHFVWPPLLVFALRRVGYDRRGLPLQIGISLVLLVAARFAAPQANLNFALRAPLFGVALGPPPVHLLATLAGMVLLFYWPTHAVLTRTLRPAPR